jgi:hypothetical protein
MSDPADPVRATIESLLDAALGFGRLIWLDAAGEIVLLDKESQTRDDHLKAEAITHKLMAEDLQALLRAALVERRRVALASLDGAANPAGPE